MYVKFLVKLLMDINTKNIIINAQNSGTLGRLILE